MATSNRSQADEFISADEVKVAPRGRKANIDADLVSTLAKLSEGQAIVVKRFGQVTEKSKRPAVSQKIRTHWRAAGRTDEPRIDFNPDTGFPQVRVKVVSD